jgi:hypothetical protein
MSFQDPYLPVGGMEGGGAGMSEYQRVMVKGMEGGKGGKSFHPTEVTYPDPVYPGVYDIYFVLDSAAAPEAAGATKVWTVEVLSARDLPEAGGAGDTYTNRMYDFDFTGFTIPTPPAGAVALGEYWLSWGAPGTGYAGAHPAVGTEGARALVPCVGGAHADGLGLRHTISPRRLRFVQAIPNRLTVAAFGVASPGGMIEMPRVRYRAAVTYDGVNATLALGAAHGITAADSIHPYTRLYPAGAGALFARTFPHGAAIASVTATEVLVATAATGGADALDVVVGSRWVRVPVHARGLVHRVTNFTGP